MRLPLAAALATMMVAAGCVTPPAAVDTASVADLDDVRALTAGVAHTASGALAALPLGEALAVGGQYSTGVAASEPTIGVLSDGTIFMTGNVPNPTCAVPPGGCPPLPYANFNNGPTLMRSTDKGQTWEDAFPKLPTGDSYKLRTWDPYVYVDRDTDRVFMDDIYPIGCGFMSWSDDAGASWGHNPVSCGNPNVNDHQTIGTAKSRGKLTVGYPNFVYRCVNNLLLTECAMSPNGGQTFTPQIPVAPESGCGGITGHLESDPEGRMYLPISCGDHPTVAITEDDGTTWHVHTIAEVPAHGLHVDMAVDEAGNVYAMWIGEDMLPWFAYSTDQAHSWSDPMLISAPDVTMIKFNAIAAGAPGKVAFAYVGTTLPDAATLDGAECGALPALPCTDPPAWADATWNAYVGVITDALAADPVIQTVTANDPADPLSRGACADRCHGMTDFIDIVIDAEGRPWASFVDVCVHDCVTDPSVLFDGNLGFAATLRTGPALRGEPLALPLLAPAMMPGDGHGH